MAIGRQLTAALVNDSLMQCGSSIGHTAVMLDQNTDALKNLTVSDLQGIGYSSADAADVVAMVASWLRLLRFIRGNDAAPVQENFMPGVKKVVGIHF
jgi:hypothetical protein